MDVALNLDILIPQAQYEGSLTANTQEAYNALVWQDERPKPTWEQLQTVVPVAPLNERLFSTFNALPLELQAAFSMARIAIKAELEEGRTEVAKIIIQNTPVPGELQPLKDTLLAEFDN